jgi:hypothetical protein
MLRSKRCEKKAPTEKFEAKSSLAHSFNTVLTFGDLHQILFAR